MCTAHVPPEKSNQINTSITKIAGFLFLFSFVVPTAVWALGLARLVVPHDPLATAANVISHPLVFRVGITVELIMAVGLATLGVALFSILQRVDRFVALLALSWKLIEATLSAAVVLLSLMAVLIAESPASTPELLLPVGYLLHAHTVLFAVPMVLLGLDMILFFTLFYRSRYIPRTMAAFGILSFILILSHALLHFVAPRIAANPMAQALFFTPSAITELVVGTWLLIRGLKQSPDHNNEV